MQLKVGLEIHGYIAEKSKLFCNCAIDENASPNIHTCPRCTGQPGSKPMLTNAVAMQKAIQIGLMLGCTINNSLIFQRKHYSWPDSPNNYQRTMSGSFASPVGEHGTFEGIGITQVHLEEDPARWDPVTGAVDYNRAGHPLIEIVTDPDFTSAEQVREWLQKLVTTLSYIQALNKAGGIKCDVNVSIGPEFERVEIKNVNSQTAIVEAILFESQRQENEKKLGNKIPMQTRTWDDEKKQTTFMRSKESASDYMFIPDPDLVVIDITDASIAELKSKLPDAPSAKYEKLVALGLTAEDAKVLSLEYTLIEVFEKLSVKHSPKVVGAYLRREAISVANYHKKDVDALVFDVAQLDVLFDLLISSKITDKVAKKILEQLLITSFDVAKYVTDNNLAAVSDSNVIGDMIKTVIAANAKAVADYKAGNMASLNFLVGQVMRQTKGAAKPDVVLELMKKEIG